MTTLARYTKRLVRFLRHNKAVSALEYALLIGVIAVAVAAALYTLGGNVKDAIVKAGNKVNQAADTAMPRN